MPLFSDNNMDKQQTASNFRFTSVGMNDLLDNGATEYTLATIAVDVSGSVDAFKDELEKCIKTIIESCKRSPRSENLLVRLISFGTKTEEIHGFKLLNSINPDDYLGSLTISGMTALVDGVLDAVEATDHMAESLIQQQYLVNGVVYVITDGCENCSAHNRTALIDAIKKVPQNEFLESLTTILIGVNTQSYDHVLKGFQMDCKMDQYVSVGDANDKNLAKLAGFISQSISSSSQALASGSPNSQSSLLTI